MTGVRHFQQTDLAAMRRQPRSSPYSRKMRPSSASGQPLTMLAASTAAPGAMRMSRGPSRWKLKPRSAESTYNILRLLSAYCGCM